MDKPPSGSNEKKEPLPGTFHASDAREIISRIQARYWSYPVYLRRSGGRWIEAASEDDVAHILGDSGTLAGAHAVEVSQTGEEE